MPTFPPAFPSVSYEWVCVAMGTHVHVGSSLRGTRREQVRKWLILSGGNREGFLEEVAFFFPP